MSADKETSPDSENPFLAPWISLFEQADVQRQALAEFYELFWSPRTIHRQWLHATSRAMDQYLRSPEFLKLMQVNLQSTIQYKLFQDQLASNSGALSSLIPNSLTSNPSAESADSDVPTVDQ